jgi:signal transduction histidine kinase
MAPMRQPATLLDHLPGGLAVLTMPGLEYELANPAYRELVAPAGDPIGRPLAEVHPDLAAALAAPIAEVARTGAPAEARDVPLPPRRPEEPATRWATFRLRAVPAERGRGPAVLVEADETTWLVIARTRLQALIALASDLDDGSPSLKETMERVATSSRDLLGADGAFVLLADSDQLRFRGTIAFEGRGVEVTADAADLPAGAEAMARREPVALRPETAGGLEAIWLRAAAKESALCDPLHAAGRPLGLLYLTWNGLAASSRVDLKFAAAVGAACSMVIRRGRILQREREAHLASQRATERLELLSESGALLTGAVDWTSVVRTTAQLALGYLADAVVVDLVGPDGVLRREAQEVSGNPPPPSVVPPGREVESPSIRDALVTRRSRRIVLPAHGGAAESGDPELVTLDELRATSCIIAPLVIRGQAAGVLTMVRRAPSPPHEPEDVDLATELARRAAVALDDARLLAAAADEAAARDAFLAAAAHDIRSPLTALRLQVEALARSTGVTDRARPRVARLRSALDRMTRRVEQALDAAGAGRRAPLARVPFDLADEARAVVTRVEDERGPKAPRVRVVAPDPVPGRWDRERVDAIFTNLIAVATKRGGEGVEVRVTPAARGGRIEVRRPGAEDDAAAPHGQAAARWEDLEVGIWIARRFAEAHGGQVRIVMLPNVGARYLVDLPG